MKNKWLSILFLFIVMVAARSQTPEQAPALLNEVGPLVHCESVAYNPSDNLVYVSVMGGKEKGDGSIAIINLEGGIENSKFIMGLNDPKGIAIEGNKLYVSDINVLVEIDLKRGKILHKYEGKDAESLNDVAIDGKGNVFVSDMGSSSIYKLDTNKNFKKWLSSPELETPNGVLVQNNYLYVVGWASQETKANEDPKGGMLKIDIGTKEITKVTPNELANLDGLQKYDENAFLVSGWNTGEIFKISKSGDSKVILKVDKSVGDILYIPGKNLLMLPMNFQNKVLIYSY